METANFCSICLINKDSLRSTSETDVNDVKWCTKLILCVPEVDWLGNLQICQACIDLLETVYTFRNMCIKSYETRCLKLATSEPRVSKDEQYTNCQEDPEKDSQHILKTTVLLREEPPIAAEENTQINENKDRFECKLCPLKFETKKMLVIHMKSQHSIATPFDCRTCGKEFRTNSQLIIHEKAHGRHKKYMCKKCKLTFNSFSEYNSHKNMLHIKSENWKFKCDHCNIRFPIAKQLNEHIKKQHLKEPQSYSCYHCSEIFNDKNLLSSHIRLQHIDGVTEPCVQCEICCINLKTRADLEEHLIEKHQIKIDDTREVKEETKEEKNDCTYCGVSFLSERTLKDHLLACIVKVEGEKDYKLVIDKITEEFGDLEDELGNLDDDSESDLKEELLKKSIKPPCKRGRKPKDKNEPVVLKCEKCGANFNTKYLLNRHIRNVHATEKLHSCDVCGQKFASPVYLSAHKRYHTGDRSHICSFCGKGYITASDLYHHEKTHANKRAYKCPDCPKAFNTSSDLHKHKICVHLDRSLWKYICSFCDRRFPLKTNLDTHTKTHTGERNFQCHLCERRCINRSVLQRHIESHSNVRSFKCQVCLQDYKYQKSLDIHMAKAHGVGNAKVPERTKKYFCHICPKSYFANNKLEKHIRSHTGERPYPCHMCDKRFIDKSYVKQHMKTAHKVTFVV